MSSQRPLFIPVILGTAREGRRSAHAAKLMLEETAKRPGVVSELIDIATLPLDASWDAIRNAGFAEKMNRADGLILVVPEYNHGYPGPLKQVLDSCLKEYIHKPAGIAGVSAGVFGGARAIQNLLAVMRELGLVTIFWDVNFSTVQNLFDDTGNLKDQSFIKRIDKFLKELIWMAKTLRHGREEIPAE